MQESKFSNDQQNLTNGKDSECQTLLQFKLRVRLYCYGSGGHVEPFVKYFLQCNHYLKPDWFSASKMRIPKVKT